MDRIKELEKILSEVCEQHEDDCSKCPRQKECDKYIHSGEICTKMIFKRYV